MRWLRRKVALAVATTAVCVGALAGCSNTAWHADSTTWTIATNNFSESTLMGQMYLQVLRHNGVDAQIKQLSTREVVVPALQKGEVQITPEYLGSLTEFLNKQINGSGAPQVATGDVASTYAAGQQLAAQRDMTLLAPSPAQNQNAFAVTGPFAAAHNLRTVSDLATYSQTNPVVLGGPPECPQRPSCQLGLEQVYGMKIASFVPLDAGGPLTIQALSQGKITVGVVFSSSGAIVGNDIAVLDDDKHLQTAENLLPAVYTPAVTDAVRRSLDSISAVLTTSDLQELNKQVDIYRRNPRRVAEAYLQEKGLI